MAVGEALLSSFLKRLGLPTFSSCPLLTVSRPFLLFSRIRTSIQAGPHISSSRNSSGACESVCRSSYLDGIATKPGVLSAATLSRSTMRCYQKFCVPGVGTISRGQCRMLSATCAPLFEGVARKMLCPRTGTGELLSLRLPLCMPEI